MADMLADIHTDVLIIGSGLAGLTAALRLAPTHRVVIVTKRAMTDGSSSWAQGGMAGVREFTDLRWITVQTTPRHYPF